MPLLTKKYLDAAGLTYFSRKLNNYPDNTVLAAVIEGIQDALDEKANTIRYRTTAEWQSTPLYIPAAGEVLVYTDHGTIDVNGETIPVPGIKVGDGIAYGIDLPFVGDDVLVSVVERISAHEGNTDIHTTAAEKAFWNNKLNCVVSEELLTLNRN